MSKIQSIIRKLRKKMYAHNFIGLHMTGGVSEDGVYRITQNECTIRFFNLYARMIDVDLVSNLDDSFSKVDVDVYVNAKKQTSWHFEKGGSVEKKLPYWVFDTDQILVDRTLRLRPFCGHKIVFKITADTPLPEPPHGLFLRQLSVVPEPRASFKINYFKYMSSPKKKDKVRRLFITTGNFSLINALCYIEETKNNAVQYEDNLLIFGAATQQFSENNLQIAQTHDFNKVMVFPIVDLEEACITNQLERIDEVVLVWQGYAFSTVAKLYPKSKLTVILESIPLFKVRNMLPQPISALYLNKYFGLLDYPYPNPEVPIWYLNKDIYHNLLNDIRKKHNLRVDVPKKDKYVLFCAPCDLVRMKLPENNMLDMIAQIKAAGYKVLLKKHPRDPKDYKDLGIELLDTSFPVEFYDLSNILCVVGYQSNMLATLAEEIPTFSYIPPEIQSGINPTQDRYTYIIKKYIMPVESLVKTKATPDFDTLQNTFKNMQQEFWKDLCKISEDKELQKKFET